MLSPLMHEGMWDSQNPMGLSVAMLDITPQGGGLQSLYTYPYFGGSQSLYTFPFKLTFAICWDYESLALKFSNWYHKLSLQHYLQA